MTEKPITVNTLLRDLKTISKMGYGDRQLFVAIDDEGNGFRPMYFTVTINEDDIKAYCDMGLVDGDVKPEDMIILG